MRQLLRAAVLLAWTPSWLGSTELPSAKVQWSRVTTANFTFYTSAGIGKTKEIALELESLRAVLAAVKESARAASPTPTVVFVFPDDDALEPYKPRSGGKPRNLAAYFLGSSDGNYIAMAARSPAMNPQRVVYHEFLHYFMSTNFLPQPVWYEEGLAEFYSTFQLVGNAARVGQTVRDHVLALRRGPMIPLDRLLTVTKDSPEYNERDRQGMFYAESWALVHYLMRGQPKRTAQLGRFLVALQNGRPLEQSFRESFQTDYAGLFGELRQYVTGTAFPYTETQMTQLEVPTDVTVQKVEREEILVRLGELLAHGGIEDLAGAQAHFQAALAVDPNCPGALSGMGFLRLRQSDSYGAEDFFDRAAAAGSDDFRTYFYEGELHMEQLAGRPVFVGQLNAAQRQELEMVRSALHKSLDLNRAFAEAHAALGRTYLMEDVSCASEGISELEIAVRMLPSRTDLARDLALLRERRGEADAINDRRSRAAAPQERAGTALAAAETSMADGLERVNALLAQRREDEALRLFEKLVAAQPAQIRHRYDERLAALRRGVAGKRAIRRFNEAVALANKGDVRGALAAFRAAAESAQDPDLSKKANEQVKQIEAALARQSANSKKSQTAN